MMSYIILVRHGESDDNAAGVVSGQSDVSLTPKGREQARLAAKQLAHLPVHAAYVSELRRTRETLGEILQELGIAAIPVTSHGALNERHFGSMTGMAKHDLLHELGQETYDAIVMGWDMPAPEGESLKMVHDRVVPYFKSFIYQDALAGKNVLVASHRQVLRALLKLLDNIPAA